MPVETTVLLVEASLLPSSLEEQLAKRGVFIEHAAMADLEQVLPVVTPDLIVQSGNGEIAGTLASLNQAASSIPLVLIADRNSIKDLRSKDYEEVKALIPQDLPVAAVAHRLSTMARRSAEGNPVDKPSQVTRAPSHPHVPKGGIAPAPTVRGDGPPSSARGSMAPAPLAPRQSVRIVDAALEEEQRRRVQERKVDERRQAEEKRQAEEEARRQRLEAQREKKAAEASERAEEMKRRAEARRQEREAAQAARQARLEEAKRKRSSEKKARRAEEAKRKAEEENEDEALEELFPSDPSRKPSVKQDFPEPNQELEEKTASVDVNQFAKQAAALDKTMVDMSPPPARAAALKKTMVGMSPPPPTRPKPQEPAMTWPSADSPSYDEPDEFVEARKNDELSVVAPLPVELRVPLAETSEKLPAIRLALLDTDLTRADILTAALRQRGMKIHPVTPDPGATRWPLLRRFAPQGLVVDEKSMARGAAEWVETFRGDPFLRHVPVILVRFSRLLAENGTDVTLDPLLHLIEPLGREEFALLEKLAPGYQVDLWLSQLAPFRLVQMLTQEDRNTRLDCRSKAERLVWHLGPGYAGHGKLLDIGSDRAKSKLSPEESLSWLLSHEDCQVSVHEHTEPLAHASESKDSEMLLHEMTEALGTPERHKSVMPPAGSLLQKIAPSLQQSDSNIPVLSDAKLSAASSSPPGPRGPAPARGLRSSPIDLDAIKRGARSAWDGYASLVARAAEPLRGKVPESVLGWLPAVGVALLLLILLVIVIPSGEETEAAIASENEQDREGVPRKASDETKRDAPKAGGERTAPEEQLAEEKKPGAAEPNELWKVAPDAKLASCKEMLGQAAPKAEAPERAVSYYRSSRRLLMVGKTEEAIENMCLSGLYDPAGPAAEGLAEYFLGQRSLEEAERWIRLALKAEPDRRSAKELLGDIENQKGNVEKAREILLETLLLEGDETQKMQMTARKLAHDAGLARRGGDLPRAERELRRAALLAPESATIATDLGDTLLRRGESDAALAWASHALKLDPNYSLAMLLGGRAAETKGDKAEARRFYEMVPLGDPFHKQAQNRRSRL